MFWYSKLQLISNAGFGLKIIYGYTHHIKYIVHPNMNLAWRMTLGQKQGWHISVKWVFVWTLNTLLSQDMIL